MRDVAHDQGVVELDAAGREDGPVVEERRGHGFDPQRPDGPSVRHEFKPVGPGSALVRGIAHAAGGEEGGAILHGREARSAGQGIGLLPDDFHRRAPVLGLHAQSDASGGVIDVEVRGELFPREEASTGELVEARSGVPTRDEDAFAPLAAFLPLDGDAVGRVLAAQSAPSRPAGRADGLEPDQADAYQGVSGVPLRLERRREQTTDDLGVGPEVHQHSPPDDALELRGSHGISRGRPARLA